MDLSVTPSFIWIYCESPSTGSHPAQAQFAQQIPAVLSSLLPSRCEQSSVQLSFSPNNFPLAGPEMTALWFSTSCTSQLPFTTFFGSSASLVSFQRSPPCSQSEQHWDCTKHCVNITGWTPSGQSPFQMFNFSSKITKKKICAEIFHRHHSAFTAQINFSLASNESAVKCWVMVNCRQFLEIKKLKDYMTRQPEVAYQPLEQRKQGIKRTAPVLALRQQGLRVWSVGQAAPWNWDYQGKGERPSSNPTWNKDLSLQQQGIPRAGQSSHN